MKAITLRKCIPITAILTLLLSLEYVRASDSCAGVIITEIMYDPSTTQGPDNANEWIEILNDSCDPVDLAGWLITDAAAGVPDELSPLDGGSTVLLPGQYALILDGIGSDVTTNPAWTIAPGTRIFGTDDASIGNGLGNTGDTVTLLDAATNVVDSVTYDNTDASGCGNEANGDGFSLERIDPLGPGDCSNFTSVGAPAIGGTPGSENHSWVGNSCLCGNVFVLDCDTGIANRYIEPGVSLQKIVDDLLAACVIGTKNHGQFVKCFGDGVNLLKKAGAITGDEKGALQSCAAQSKLP